MENDYIYSSPLQDAHPDGSANSFLIQERLCHKDQISQSMRSNYGKDTHTHTHTHTRTHTHPAGLSRNPFPLSTYQLQLIQLQNTDSGFNYFDYVELRCQHFFTFDLCLARTHHSRRDTYSSISSKDPLLFSNSPEGLHGAG
jgi:hypothetical protein